MDDGQSSPIALTERGTVDVAKEMEVLSKLKASGISIEGMDRLLFTDIGSYARRKRLLIREQLKTFEDTRIEGQERSVSNNTSEEKKTTDPGDHDNVLLYGSYGKAMDGAIRTQGEEELLIDLSEKEEETSPSDGTGKPASTVGKTERQEHSDLPKGEKIEKQPPAQSNVLQKRDQSGPSKRGLMLIIIATIILLSTLLGTSIYLILQNGDDGGPTDVASADFTVNDIAPKSGDLIDLRVKEPLERATYAWSIFPSTYDVFSGSLGESSLMVYFKREGSYRIDLRVKDGGKDLTSYKFVDVAERTFLVSRERYGDIYTFNASGDLTIDNIGSVIPTKEFLSYDRLHVDFWSEPDGPMESTIGGALVDAKDGLGSEYKHLQRGSVQSLTFEGYLERTEKAARIRSTLNGRSDISQTTLVDVYNKRPTRITTDASSDYSIQAVAGTTVDYILNEKGTVLTDLRSDLKELKVEDISEGRDMRSGMQGTTGWGTHELEWTAVEVDRIGGRPALRIDLELSNNDLRKLDLSSFDLSLWISDGIPVSVMSVLNLSSERDVRTPYELNYSQELNTFQPGTTAILYGDTSTKHDTVLRADSAMPVLAGEFHTNWTYLPELGSMPSTVPFDFTAQDAIAKFESSPEFRLYLKSNPDLFGVMSNYSKFSGEERWRFSMGERGDGIAWNQTVRRNEADIGYPDNIEPVDLQRGDIGPVLTFSGSEHCLKTFLSTLDPTSAIVAYGSAVPSASSKLDVARMSLGTRVDMRYPMVGLFNTGLMENIPICFHVESFDGSFETGIDMTNGQLAFVHSSMIQKL